MPSIYMQIGQIGSNRFHTLMQIRLILTYTIDSPTRVSNIRSLSQLVPDPVAWMPGPMVPR